MPLLSLIQLENVDPRSLNSLRFFENQQRQKTVDRTGNDFNLTYIYIYIYIYMYSGAGTQRAITTQLC
jgi:hypothetical protein